MILDFIWNLSSSLKYKEQNIASATITTKVTTKVQMLAMYKVSCSSMVAFGTINDALMTL